MKTNWQTKKLGEVCDFEGGSQPPKVNFIHEPRKGYVRFLQIRDFGSDKHITYIPDSNKNRHCTEEDILLGRYGASVGKILINKKGAYNVAVMKTIPNLDILDKKYFYFYLISDEFQKRLSKVAARSAQAGFSKDDIYDFPIIVPPLPEQHRIVKILDKVFADVAKAKENAEKNLQNAKELFESYLQSVFANPGNDWEEKTLNNICIVERGSSPRPIKNFITDDSDGVNWIKIGDTKNVDRYLYTTRQKITKKGAEKSRYVKEGDLILSNSMSFGKPYIMKTSGYIHDGWFVLRPNTNINPEFFYDLLFSPQIQKQITTLASGSVVKNISGDLIKKVILPIPSIKEQKSIVAKLYALSAETKKLETIYQQKLADLEELKKSVLKRAFNGDL